MRKRLFSFGKDHFDQFSVIVRTDLLCNEHSAGFQQPFDFLRAKVAVTVDNNIEGFIIKGNI